MAELREDVLTVSEVSVDLDMQVLFLPRIDNPESLSGSEYLALSNFVVRHAVAGAVARTCAAISVQAPVCRYRETTYPFFGQSGSETRGRRAWAPSPDRRVWSPRRRPGCWP